MQGIPIASVVPTEYNAVVPSTTLQDLQTPLAKGDRSLNSQDYEGAVGRFKRAPDYAERPALLTNIGAAAVAVGKYEDAVRYWGYELR